MNTKLPIVAGELNHLKAITAGELQELVERDAFFATPMEAVLAYLDRTTDKTVIARKPGAVEAALLTQIAELQAEVEGLSTKRVCKNCKWWEDPSPNSARKVAGPCNKVTPSWNNNHASAITGRPRDVACGPGFGCIHFEKKGGQ